MDLILICFAVVWLFLKVVPSVSAYSSPLGYAYASVKRTIEKVRYVGSCIVVEWVYTHIWFVCMWKLYLVRLGTDIKW